MEAVILFPAIDLKDGNCVRLRQGEMDQATVFNEDPAAQARSFEEQGFEWLHVVDLNGAFEGRPVNAAAVEAVMAAIHIPVQLGGGIRDLDTIEKYLDYGVAYVIIGTAAVKNPGFLSDACTAFSGHVLVALDAKDGKVAVEGWSKLTGHDVVDLAKKFEDYGVEAIIYTDIGRDGMLTGVNVDATVRLARELRTPVIASGGLTSLNEVQALCAIESEGIVGVITGRALYQGTLDLKQAQAEADKLSGKDG
jgi:phosphoribosylformimino-5-aminoimidazole carboxamide ribotide isomerase